ncbi:amidase domain-containing protein [Staphylococcus taiwanensis]|nr:amidase domain-containing protein [Staphylococcus taiwanensis]
MSKHRLMIYFLTTTLVLPTFSSSIAHADDDNAGAKSKASTSQSKDDTTSSNDNNDDVDNTNSEETSDSHSKDTDTATSEEPSKETKSNQKNVNKAKNSKLSSNTKDKASQTHQTTTHKDNTYRTPLSPIFDATQSSGLNASKFLNPNLYDNGFSLTNLIASIFHFNSDISDYEQPANTNDTSENDNTNSGDENDVSTEKHTSSTETSNNDDTNTKEANKSNETPREESNNASNQSTTSQNKDDANVSKALDAIDDLVSDKEDSSSANQSNQNDGENTTDKNDSTKEQTPSNQTDSSNNNATSGSKSEDKSFSESALDSVLDKYSEDAKQTHHNYESSKKESTSKKTTDSATNKDTTSKSVNPQLPTKAELEHKTEPAQSFEDDFKKSNTRSTSLFQTLPQLDGNDVSDGDIAVVENKDTRNFIKSIAKDAHKIGQDKDIYASVMIAQAILESSSGNSALAQSPNYNLFGIKGSYKGQSVNFNTLEANSDNSMFNINAGFRKYPSTKESLEDYATLIKNGIEGNPTIYKPTWKSEAIDYRDATQNLSRTYATDPNYATKLNSLIKHYHLTDFDKKKMPDLDHYAKSSSSGTDVAGGDFKAFEITDTSSPYPQGQCTWYVYERVQQFGKKVGSDWGDAHNWDNRAEDDGYNVSRTPKAHTAVVFEAGQAGAHDVYGHVAFVEKVNDDGSIIISESNVKGLGIVSYRTIDADTAKELHYIEPK